MITIKEKIIVTQDDTMLSEYRKLLTEENGWKVTEYTMTVVFIRVQFLGIETQTK
jgi:hypothetical protein